ncbi:hypothetical protein M9H77_23056 [Catharanthus roseus]|uniref:Uncharacterized protein n=1 Tax=Catharanthus roseus TaxID=4058 RepID=A0ACC0ARY3_CATRO|nr:hypothetical protein M9H77_23056 [Catharanthus roseus]
MFVGLQHQSRIQRIALYVASPRTRASSDGVDDLDSGEWIHLKRGVNCGGCSPIGVRGHRIMLYGGFRLSSEESGGTRHRGWSQGRPSRPCPLNSIVALHVSLHSGVEVALMCLDSLRLPNRTRNPYSSSSTNIVKIKVLPRGWALVFFRTYSLVPRGTQIPYSAAVDLVAGLRVSQVPFDFSGSTNPKGALVSESNWTSLSSLFSLREIVPERDPVPIIDLSDNETLEGLVVQGVEHGVSIEEDSSEAEFDARMLPKPEGVALVDTEGVDTLVVGGSPAHRQATVRAIMLETEVVQVREAHMAREREIQELVDERDWLKRFIAQFIGTTRDSVDRVMPSWSPGQKVPVADTLRGSRPRIGQPETTRENTPRPEQATHTIMENFMIRMKKLLETSMTTRRNERIRATGADELSDIYDTLNYEDSLRVTFVAFRLRGMGKDWWVKASEARALKNQPSTWNNFQEEFRKEIGNEGRGTLTPIRVHRVCTYCGRSRHVAEVCYQKSRLCYWCGKSGHIRDQYPEMQQIPPETSRKTGRPPDMREATEEMSDKPQVKAKVYTLDGLSVDTGVDIVEGMIPIFSQLARLIVGTLMGVSKITEIDHLITSRSRILFQSRFKTRILSGMSKGKYLLTPDLGIMSLFYATWIDKYTRDIRRLGDFLRACDNSGRSVSRTSKGRAMTDWI